jgi:hypothetical protein
MEELVAGYQTIRKHVLALASINAQNAAKQDQGGWYHFLIISGKLMGFFSN